MMPPGVRGKASRTTASMRSSGTVSVPEQSTEIEVGSAMPMA